MSIVRLDAVRREIGDLVILDGISASIARGDRIGLVGANGAGKTTLLEIVAGREEPDGGRVHRSRGTRLGLLSQEAGLDDAFRAAPSVRAVVRAGAERLEAMERTLAELEGRGAAGVGTREYADLQERFEAADGYHLDQRVEATLAGLGIARPDWHRRPLELSGGEQTRVALARLLIADPDLLMLDEPTNHLDIGALEWLEAALGRRDGSLLVASHDRAFLDAVVGRVWELRDRRLTAFRGGYSAYLSQREAADARARREVDTTDRAIAREVELVQRYRSQRKHVKMHEHERRLERLHEGRAEGPRRTAGLALPGGAPGRLSVGRSADVVVELEDVVCGFAATASGHAVPVTRVARLAAGRGERIGLVGPNGAGKTTLLRTIAGELAPLHGYVRIGRGVGAGYLAQLRERPLPGATVLEAMLASAPVTEREGRSYLARFLFRGDDVFTPVAELSGGERSRLELAIMGVGAANLLLLDEPTNHLDIPAREALETFLRGSEATIIVVSHDRRLLRTVCQRLWVVEPGAPGEPASAVPYDDGYDAWRAAVAEGWTVAGELARRSGRRPLHEVSERAGGGASVADAARPSADGPRDGRNGRSVPADDGGRAGVAVRAPERLSKDAYRRERRRIEGDLARLEGRKAELERELAEPDRLGDFIELRRLTSELADVDRALAQAEDAWLAVEERAP